MNKRNFIFNALFYVFLFYSGTVSSAILAVDIRDLTPCSKYLTAQEPQRNLTGSTLSLKFSDEEDTFYISEGQIKAGRIVLPPGITSFSISGRITGQTQQNGGFLYNLPIDIDMDDLTGTGPTVEAVIYRDSMLMNTTVAYFVIGSVDNVNFGGYTATLGFATNEGVELYKSWLQNACLDASVPATSFSVSSTFDNVTPPLNGQVTVTDDSGDTFTCSSSSNECTRIYNQGTQISLSAVANSGYEFIGWAGDTCPVNGNTQATLSNVAIISSATCIPQFTQISAPEPEPTAPSLSIDLREVMGILSLAGADTSNVAMEMVGRQDETETGEPKQLSKTDFAQVFDLEKSLLTLNVTINPASSGSVDIILLAIWDDNDNQIAPVWLEKIAPQGSFDFNDATVWKTVDSTDLASIQTYRKNWNAAIPFSSSFGSGRVVAPNSLGNEGRTLTFIPAYKAGNDYVFSGFVLALPDRVAVLNNLYQVTMNASLAITANSASNTSIFECSVANTSVATVSRVPNNGVPACQVQGIAVGTTILTVTTAANETVTTEIQVLPTSLDRLLNASYEVTNGSSFDVEANADSDEDIFDCAMADTSIATVSRVPVDGKTVCRIQGVSVGDTELTVTTNASETTTAIIKVIQ